MDKERLATREASATTPTLTADLEIAEVRPEGRAAVAEMLQSWIKTAGTVLLPELRPQLRSTDRDYVISEITAMVSGLRSSPSAKEHYFAATFKGRVLAVMKVGVWKNLQLNHIVAMPKRAGEGWPCRQSPVSGLMLRAESYAREVGKTVITLDAEDPSLIPLYFYYGYTLVDSALHAEVARVLGLDSTGPGEWKAACQGVLKALPTEHGDAWGKEISRIAMPDPRGSTRKQCKRRWCSHVRPQMSTLGASLVTDDGPSACTTMWLRLVFDRVSAGTR
jgi:hypothetical protein